MRNRSVKISSIKNKVFSFILVPLVICIICCSSKQIKIVPLKPYQDEGKAADSASYKLKFFLIKNYKPSDSNFSRIDSFAIGNLEDNYHVYDTYQMVFYEEANELDENFSPTESKRLEWHGDNIVLIYTWQKGRYIVYERFKNGKILFSKAFTQDGNVIRTDTLDLKVKPRKN